MIWLFTDDAWRPVADKVASHLEVSDAAVRIVDSSTIATLSVHIHSNAKVRVSIAGDDVELPASIAAFRSPIPQQAGLENLDHDVQTFVRQQWEVHLKGFLLASERLGTTVLNGPRTQALEEKTLELVAAAQAGFLTPPTVQTADPDAVCFAQEVPPVETVIVKMFRPLVRRDDEAGRVSWTKSNAMPIAKIRSDLSAARFKAPLVVQPLIDAPYEHRVTVVGDAVFAARTERTGHNAVDVRTVPVSEAGVTRSRLPDAVISQCVRLVDGLGLDYAVLDLLETGAGDYVFLDLNPAGHFLWVEQLTGAPITDAIADLLLDGCAIGARS